MVKNIGNIAPSVFNEAALKQINKPYLIEALVVVKANEENLLSMVNSNKKISDSAIQNLEKANSYTDLALLKTDIAKVITSLKELKIEVKLKEGNYDHVEPEQVIDLTPQSLNTNQNLIKSERPELINNKIVKLDSNTPIFSNKTGDRLDEWLFVLNNAFSCLKVTDSIEKLKLATKNHFMMI